MYREELSSHHNNDGLIWEGDSEVMRALEVGRLFRMPPQSLWTSCWMSQGREDKARAVTDA